MDDPAALKVFALYRDSPPRRLALEMPVGSPERDCLYGFDQLIARGLDVEPNLGRPIRGWARAVDKVANRVLHLIGGYGGDFAGVTPSLRRMNAADVVYSTVDTVGLPLVLLGKASLVRRPVVYTAIGLPERLDRLRGERARKLYAAALNRARTVITFSDFEAETLRSWLGPSSPPVTFLPFAVDPAYFKPLPERPVDVDVVSIGADPRRDFALLVAFAGRNPGRRVRIVTTADQASALGRVPPNVELERDVPFGEVRDRLASGRVVALPVKDNSYSGATTVLLQAMAMGKPVVVSRTRAIETGYDLVDGENCRLVPPGDAAAFEQALTALLSDDATAAAIGERARRTAETFSWERYAESLEGILRAAAEG